MTASFNLVDQPWIVVLDDRGRTTEASIRDVLVGGGGMITIGGDLPTQQFAITRLLLAILRRAVDWGTDPVARWGKLWSARALPGDEINSYLDRVRPRFDLLDFSEPFYQVADFHTPSGAIRPVGLLVSDVPAKHQYFTTRAGSGATELSLGEAARWVVHAQAYDTSGIKTGDSRDPRTRGGKGYPMGIAWCGQLGGVLVEGASLHETLLLNTVLLTANGPALFTHDYPAWERPHCGVTMREDPTPSGPTDLLTWQSRRIKLTHGGDRVTGVLVGNGDPIDATLQLHREHLTAWRYSTNKSKEIGQPAYYPRTFDAGRAVWEGIESLLVDSIDESSRLRGFAPDVMHWIDVVVDRGFVAPDAVISPHVFGLRYDTQSSVIGAAIDDQIILRPAALVDPECREAAITAARRADGVARSCGTLAGDLAVAAGGDGTGERAGATASFLSTVDTMYRSWVLGLGVDDPTELLQEWESKLLSLARFAGAASIARAGRPAFVGREITNSKGRSYWLDAPTAEMSFYQALRRELPGAHAPRTEVRA